MSNISKIHQGKTPIRLHYIAEWAKKRGLRQTDFVTELDIPKGTVSRWFNGQLPDQNNIIRVASFLQLEEPAVLFRHPEDDWLARLIKGRAEEERARIGAMIEAAFPRKTG